MAKQKSAPKPYQVFVSHATADKWLAKTLCEKLEAAGATTFRDDRDIAGGDSIPAEIGRQIVRSKELVVLLTPDSINRQWVLLEIGAVLVPSLHIRVVPVRCHVTVDNIPEMVKERKSISLNDFDDYLNELSKRVRSYYDKTRRGK